MRTITQQSNITVNGVDETKRVSNVSVTNEINRGYNVATLISDKKLIEQSNITIILGDYTFIGFIHKVTQSGKNTYTVECRTNNAKLTTPYSQSESIIEPAATSSELWAYYNSEYGTNIVSSEVDINFGANFKREGTVLQAIDAICSVTGAEYYDNGTSLIITPLQSIKNIGTIINDDEIFDFISYENDYENTNINRVVINDNISAQSKSVSVEFDGMDVYMYPNNISTLLGTKGLTTDFIDYNYKPLIRHKEITKTSQIILKTAVISVDKVTVNGVERGYVHESGSNIIGFDEEVRGVVIVDYIGMAFKSSVRNEFYFFDVLVGDVWEYYQGEIGESCCRTTDGVKIFTPNRLNYEKGFALYATSAIGYNFEVNGVTAPIGVSEVSFPFVVTESMRLEELNTITFSHDIGSVVGVKYQGTELPFTLSGRVITLNLQVPYDYTDGFEVTYSFDSFRYDIKGNHIDGDVTMIINQNIILTLFSSNKDNINDVPTEYPATVPVDVASELSLAIHEVQGNVIAVSKEGTVVSQVAVDPFGFIHPIIPSIGDYDCDVSSIDPTATMQIRAKCP